MKSFLESTRELHETIEKLKEKSSYQLLNCNHSKIHKDNLMAEKRVAFMLDEISEHSSELIATYEDREGLFRKDVQAMSGAGVDDALSEFYSRLKEVKDYYHDLPNELFMPFDPSAPHRDSSLETQEMDALFSGEEVYGRYLDLHQLYQSYLNLKGVEKINYLTYLDRFDRFKIIPSSTKNGAEYFKYLAELESYLINWIKRCRPLFMHEKLQQHAKNEFEQLWQEGTVPLWERQKPNGDLSLYCLACDKHFSKQTVFEGHKNGKKHIKAVQALQDIQCSSKGLIEIVIDCKLVNEKEKEKASKEAAELEYQKKKPTALLEFLIGMYITSFLAPIREETKGHVERKQALTDKERMDDAEEEPIELQVESDQEEEDKIYNPLKLPIGWDGKPIPFWLYKLHGLGIEYPCEICGGYVYMGRKAFEKHFQEYRHAHGMKSLGIPNSRYFQDITSIADAYALAEKLKSAAKSNSTSADVIEEFEDEQGNVFNKKTYEDLKRQGII